MEFLEWKENTRCAISNIIAWAYFASILFRASIWRGCYYLRSGVILDLLSYRAGKNSIVATQCVLPLELTDRINLRMEDYGSNPNNFTEYISYTYSRCWSSEKVQILLTTDL
jgi:hypothetical protein